MPKINRDKIVRAAVGSARLEGYKGTHRVTDVKKAGSASVKTTSKVDTKH
jgi:hypothetical protein